MRFLNENIYILVLISFNFVPKCPIDKKSALVQHRRCDKSLLKPVLTKIHINLLHAPNMLTLYVLNFSEGT